MLSHVSQFGQSCFINRHYFGCWGSLFHKYLGPYIKAWRSPLVLGTVPSIVPYMRASGGVIPRKLSWGKIYNNWHTHKYCSKKDIPFCTVATHVHGSPLVPIFVPRSPFSPFQVKEGETRSVGLLYVWTFGGSVSFGDFFPFLGPPFLNFKVTGQRFLMLLYFFCIWCWLIVRSCINGLPRCGRKF